MTARNYSISPVQAWGELGFGQLTPRQAGRVTRACNELWAYDNALEEVTRKRGEHDKDPRVEDVILAHEIDTLYREREFAGLEVDDGGSG